ncbi:uncharacterized protein [Antedon mediterranea]|uniref:uncharacterized protein isoform X2 n=1 Tax=Antedon mediterranea TaxID=105859 RepID=UPI003AF76704
MQYTKEVALLEAAFQLAEKQYSGANLANTCLGDISQDNEDQPLAQVADTLITGISEIIGGLECPLSDEEQKHTSFVVHSVLFNSFYKQILSLKGNEQKKASSRNQNNATYCILDVFPRIGSMLYYILLVRFNWGNLFGQMVSVLRPETSTLILHEILSQCIKEPQPQMERFLADIVSGILPDSLSKSHPDVLSNQRSAVSFHQLKWKNLLLFYNMVFDRLSKGYSESENCNSICKLTSSCLLCLFDFLSSHLRREITMIEDVKFQMEDRLYDITNTMQISTDIPIQFYQKLQQMFLDESVNKPIFDKLRNSSHCILNDNLQSFLDDFLCSFNRCIAACKLVDTLQKSNIENQEKGKLGKTCYYLWKCLKPFIGAQESNLTSLYLLENEFDKFCQTEKTGEAADEKLEPIQTIEDDLKEAIWRVDNRLIGYQENLFWLLNCSVNSNEIWISCLERNVVNISSLKLLKCLVDCTIRHQLECDIKTKYDLVKRLLKVLLKSYKLVSTGIQNRVRDYFTDQQHQLLDFYLYEEYDSAGLQQQIVAAFNKLVNSRNHDNIQELLQYISPVAFQSPRQTIQKSVMESVSNSGIIPLISKIFQNMTSMCFFKDNNSTTTLLCITLKDKAVRISSAKQQNNFIDLIKSLLEPFTPSLYPESLYLKPTVLSSEELLEVCIYPNLHQQSRDENADHSILGEGVHCQNINLLLCLELLKVTLAAPISGGKFAEKVDSEHRYPMMVCLASFVNECIILWDGNEGCVREDVKEISKSLLEVLCKTQQSTESDIKGLQWLMFKAKSFHWSVELYLSFLFADYQNKEVAAQVSISNFSNMEWKTTHLKPESHEKTLLTFFQCCQVSPAIAEIHMQDIFHNYSAKDDLLAAVVQALVQVLLQCTQPEWINITTALRNLLLKQIIHIPLSTEFICQLPLLDLKEYSVDLGVSSLFLMVFELLGSKSYSWTRSNGIWTHTVKCYLAIMKDLLSKIPTDTSLDQALSRGFLIGQVLCHSLKIMSFIPPTNQSQLFVLTLELVSMLEKSTEGAVQEMLVVTKQYWIFDNLVLCMEDSEEKTTLQQKIKTLKAM